MGIGIDMPHDGYVRPGIVCSCLDFSLIIRTPPPHQPAMPVEMLLHGFVVGVVVLL